MAQPIKNITIVGGGTAGWMAAALLSRSLNGPAGRSSGDPNHVNITLIESPDIPTVGVGEATVPAMPRVLRQLGISEDEFFKECNASYKLGVLFGGWNVDRDGKKYDFLNAFNAGHHIDGLPVAGYFLKTADRKSSMAKLADDYVKVNSPALELIRTCKGPKAIGDKNYRAGIGFAYHLDAGRFAGMLERHATEAGVTHILDNVTGFEQDEDGNISSIQLKERGEHKVELVIDCSGFRGLIVRETLGEPFISYDKYLLNDRALAVQIPHSQKGKLEPVTRSTALGAGWSWRVPLYNRVGTGYVFSSRFRTDEEAIDEFLNYLGPSAKGATPRVIPMRIGRNRNVWAKNCISIGLSAGFIEPLESTAIFVIEMAIRMLFVYFPDLSFNPAQRNRYNQIMSDLYDEVLDFIVLHYHLNNRTDEPYWVAAREEMVVPDTLKENLEIWRYNLPTNYDLKSHHLFEKDVYTAVLISKGFYADETPRNIGRISMQHWEAYLADMNRQKQAFIRAMPGQYELLTSIRGGGAVTGGIGLGLPGLGSTPTVPLPGSVGGSMQPPSRDDANLL